MSNDTKSYRVTGCIPDSDGYDDYNGVYNHHKTISNGTIIYKSARGKWLRFTSGGYGWDLGWYTNSNNKLDSTCPPVEGWEFNGGCCNPPDLGSTIRISKV